MAVSAHVGAVADAHVKASLDCCALACLRPRVSPEVFNAAARRAVAAQDAVAALPVEDGLRILSRSRELCEAALPGWQG